MAHVPHPLFLKLALALVALFELVYLLTRNGSEWKPPHAKALFLAFVVFLAASFVSHAFDTESISLRSRTLFFISLFPMSALENGARRMKQGKLDKPPPPSPISGKSQWRRRQRKENE